MPPIEVSWVIQGVLTLQQELFGSSRRAHAFAGLGSGVGLAHGTAAGAPWHTLGAAPAFPPGHIP